MLAGAQLLDGLEPGRLEELDAALLLPNGRLRLMPTAELLAFGLSRLRAWCVLRARYQLVTRELVQWLSDRIAGRPALEIGAGMGDLGWHLGIPQTDLGLQGDHFEASGFCDHPLYRDRAPTELPADVERLEADAALAKHSPSVVVGAWITQRRHDKRRPAREVLDAPALASTLIPYGVEEVRILQIASYIHVGNTGVHQGKRIYSVKHRIYHPEGLVSRGIDQSKNEIRVWVRRDSRGARGGEL
jgi:hypothetical protein